MNCQECLNQMIDVLYGEDNDPRRCYLFFKHLEECPECDREYITLLETRELLGQWEINEQPAFDDGQSRFERPKLSGFRAAWWPLVQRIAASVLIVIGIISTLGFTGIWKNPRVMVSQVELAEMVNDMIVARQEEDWRMIGTALIELKEEIEARRRIELQTVYQDLQEIQERYLDALEENNRQIQRLVNR